MKEIEYYMREYLQMTIRETKYEFTGCAPIYTEYSLGRKNLRYFMLRRRHLKFKYPVFKSDSIFPNFSLVFTEEKVLYTKDERK